MSTPSTQVQTAAAAPAPAPNRSVVGRLAERFGMEPAAFQQTIIATCFPSGKQVTREQFAAFAIVADQYGLNPVTKELYAFPGKGGGIVPIVSVDGWSRIINDHPAFDGVEFEYQDDSEGRPYSVTCVMYRKDRGHPTRVTEFMEECYRKTDPWDSHGRRMLRHKSYMQCGRIAFGFSGIYDEDEAERIREAEILEVRETAGAKPKTLDELAARAKPRTVDVTPPPPPETAAAVEEREAALADPDDAAPVTEDDGSPEGAFFGSGS